MKHFSYFILFCFLFSCKSTKNDAVDLLSTSDSSASLLYEGEKHFKNMKQLTFEGDNAEAYWSFNDSKLVFQAKNINWNAECDQIFITDTNNYTMDVMQPNLFIADWID